MNRRDALKYTATALGYSLSAASLASIVQSCQQEAAAPDWTPAAMSPEIAEMVAEMAETILPRTDTPGAKDVHVHRFIDKMMAEYMNEANRTQALAGLESLAKHCQDQNGKSFTALSAEKQLEYLNGLNKSAMQAEQPSEADQLFMNLKSTVISTYFSSEKVGKEVLAYLPIPGDYDPCMPLEEVGKAWSLS